MQNWHGDNILQECVSQYVTQTIILLLTSDQFILNATHCKHIIKVISG